MKQTLQAVYTERKLNFENYTLAPFILSRVLSMNEKLIVRVQKINKYLFYCDKEILYALFHYLVPKQNHISWRKYIKGLDDIKNEFDFLFEKIKVFYCWDERTLRLNINLLLKMFEDKKVLRNYFRFFGIDKKYYKKYDVPFKIEKKWF